jgi:hypothetical protein
VTVIISRVANALIANVDVTAPTTSVNRRVLDRYRRRYGGLWVGGRLTVTNTDVQFHANALNRSIQAGQLEIIIDLRSIESVELLPGVLTKIVAIRTGDRMNKFRCFGAAKVADQIRAAASSAGSAQTGRRNHEGDAVGFFQKKRQTADDAKVYYSTPFGNTTDGKQKVFLLARDGMQFFPVFRSRESLIAYYEKANRAGYMILEGDVQTVLETIRSIELMKDVAVVIEPLSQNPVEIMPPP